MKQVMINELFRPANLISISRILLGIVVYLLLDSTDTQSALWALGLLILAGVTDFFDGYVARISLAAGASPSAFGEALDPIADKIFAVIIIIGLIQFRAFPLWLAGVIIGRDLLILTAGMLIARRRKIIVRSNLPGKYYFAALAVLLACFVARFEFGIMFFTYITLGLWLWSAGAYVAVYRQSPRLYLASEENQGGQRKRRAAMFRFIATVAFSLVTLYYLVQENPLGW